MVFLYCVRTDRPVAVRVALSRPRTGPNLGEIPALPGGGGLDGKIGLCGWVAICVRLR